MTPRTSAASRPIREDWRDRRSTMPRASMAGSAVIGGSVPALRALRKLNITSLLAQRVRIESPESPLPQLRAQPRDRLTVELAHAALGHAEHSRDLLEVHVVLVVHAH